MTNLTIGLIREGKIPQDNRVALTPDQSKALQENYPGLKIIAEPSEIRCFSDKEYKQAGIEVAHRMEECDLLLGIKEVPAHDLIPEKTYMFFSHTIKMQPYNRDMLRTIIDKQIRLIDYELLTDDEGKRIIGFGHFAGITGAHYGLLMYGKKTDAYDLLPAYKAHNYASLISHYHGIHFPPFKALIAGDGSVGEGAKEVLQKAGITEVTPETFKSQTFDKPVFTQLGMQDLYKPQDNSPFQKETFKENPEKHESRFPEYMPHTDLFINAIYWEKGVPRHFTTKETEREDFKVKVIADISCDIQGSVPITVQHTNQTNPVYGFDPVNKDLTTPYQPNTIDVMAISNLPNELPRDASEAFGEVLKSRVIPDFIENCDGKMFRDATITKNGALTEPFQYLKSFVEEP